MKLTYFLLLCIVTLTSSAVAEIIGYDGFHYGGLGPVNGLGEGVYWDWKNTAPTSHTGAVSTWDAVYNAPRAENGYLVTQESGAKREFGLDETTSAVNFSNANANVYFKTVFTLPASGAGWYGLSSFDFGTERLFFGVFPDGTGKFSIYDQNTFTRMALSTVTGVAGQTYTLVARLDFANAFVRLYINPDLTQPEPSAATASSGYSDTYWSTAVRLASGGTGQVLWDEVLVATSWQNLRTFKTTTFADENDSPSGVAVSLREAVRDAQNAAGENIVDCLGATLDPARGPITLTDSAGVTLVSTLEGSIRGSTARLFQVNVGGKLSVFDTKFDGGGGAGTDAGGQISISNSGNVLVQRCEFTGSLGTTGGAVFNSGTFQATDCYFHDNQATNGGAVANGLGGSGTATLQNCTLADNIADNSAGAVLNNGFLTMRQCTVTRNICNGNGYAVAIANQTGNLVMTHCTVAENPIKAGPAIYNYASATLNLVNSIVANNPLDGSGTYVLDRDLANYGTLVRSGGNILQSTGNWGTGTSSGTSAMTSDPLLAPLSYYGGLWPTMLPLANSPAVDAGTTISSLTRDARGKGRLRDGNRDANAAADLGAVERNVVWVTTSADLFRLVHPGSMSLREAFFEPGMSEISFDPAAFPAGARTITLSASLGQLSNVADANLDASNLSGALTIDGGTGVNRCLQVGLETSVSLHFIKVTGGTLTELGAAGCGVLSNGQLTLNRCEVSGNEAPADSVCAGVDFFRSVTSGDRSRHPIHLRAYDSEVRNQLTGCTVNESESTSEFRRCTFRDNGTGLSHSAEITLEQCTLSSNGMGISSAGVLHLVHCTVAGNNTGIYQTNRHLYLSNSIVSANIALDLRYGYLLTQEGVNMVQTFELGSLATVTPTFYNAAPNLAPLGYYGGFTPTMPPLTGSPAINAGTSIPALKLILTDQRGRRRITQTVVPAVDLGAAERSEWMVNTTADELDTPTGAHVSLREALRDATTSDIIFDPSVFTGGNVITLDPARGQLVVSRSVNIDASNIDGGVVLNGGTGVNRILQVPSGLALGIQNVILMDGVNTDFPEIPGGAILNDGQLTLSRCRLTNNRTINGGAIRTSNWLRLVDCTLDHNSAEGDGGAIRNSGEAQLLHCTLENNTVQEGGGGGISNDGELALIQCTVSENFGPYGAAIYNYGRTFLTHCTVAGNLVPTATEAVIENAITGRLTLTNSIVSANRGVAATWRDIENKGATQRTGTNFVQYFHNAGTVAGASIVTLDPLVAPLEYYGGLTKTMALRNGSLARNLASDLLPAILQDQRHHGVTNQPDVGAYESGNLAPVDAYSPSCAAYLAETLPSTGPATSVGLTADFDSDGVSNFNECLAHTNAADAASFLRIISITRSGSNLQITFPTAAGVLYDIQYSDSMAAYTWGSSAGLIIGTGVNQTISIPMPAATVRKRFYRVSTVNPATVK